MPSLKEISIETCDGSKSDELKGFKLDFSQCIRLRKVKTENNRLIKSADLSTLKCLDVVAFSRCPALESIVGLTELHLLIKVNVYECPAMERLPYLGNLKALAKLKLRFSGVVTNQASRICIH